MKKYFRFIFFIILILIISLFMFIPWIIEFKSSYIFKTNYSGLVRIIPSVTEDVIANKKILPNLVFQALGDDFEVHFTVSPVSDEIKCVSLNNITLTSKDEKFDLNKYLKNIFASSSGYIDNPVMVFEKGEYGFNYYNLNYSKISLKEKSYILQLNLTVQTDKEIENLIIEYNLKRKRSLKISFMTV